MLVIYKNLNYGLHGISYIYRSTGLIKLQEIEISYPTGPCISNYGIQRYRDVLDSRGITEEEIAAVAMALLLLILVETARRRRKHSGRR